MNNNHWNRRFQFILKNCSLSPHTITPACFGKKYVEKTKAKKTVQKMNFDTIWSEKKREVQKKKKRESRRWSPAKTFLERIELLTLGFSD